MPWMWSALWAPQFARECVQSRGPRDFVWMILNDENRPVLAPNVRQSCELPSARQFTARAISYRRDHDAIHEQRRRFDLKLIERAKQATGFAIRQRFRQHHRIHTGTRRVLQQ